MPNQNSRTHWEETANKFTEIFAGKTRDEWCAIFDGTDACVAPVLGLGEVDDHPHPKARQLLIRDDNGNCEPAPAPRLSRTPGSVQRPMPKVGQHTQEVLREYGLRDDELAPLLERGAISLQN
jgi:alpha-methylacyl-CoA racemase